MRTIKNLLFILTSLLFLLSCQQDFKEIVLFDYESDKELDQLYWSCHVLYSVSNDHATHGSKSLKLELFPSDYPGMIPVLAVKDWRDYREFCFDVYNPSEQVVQLWVRIDDRKNYPDSNDRYENKFVLKEGNNHISIPLESLITLGSNRHLDLAKIHRLFIYVHHPIKKTTLYVDYILLKKDG